MEHRFSSKILVKSEASGAYSAGAYQKKVCNGPVKIYGITGLGNEQWTKLDEYTLFFNKHQRYKHR